LSTYTSKNTSTDTYFENNLYLNALKNKYLKNKERNNGNNAAIRLPDYVVYKNIRKSLLIFVCALPDSEYHANQTNSSELYVDFALILT